MNKFRIFLVFLLIGLWTAVLLPPIYKRFQAANTGKAQRQLECVQKEKIPTFTEALRLLETRKDKEALEIFEMILLKQPQNPDALWGKAEVLRRSRKFTESEKILNLILKVNPQHAPALLALSYIRYKDGKLSQAQELVKKALKSDCPEKENIALAYIMLGSINGKRCVEGRIFDKVWYGLQIKGYFLKAERLAPDFPEVHLGLGTFYLFAPGIAGGNFSEALQELQEAVKLAPDFATANARLAQAYKKTGNLEKYNFYLQKTKTLDPENEVLAEIKEGRF